MLQLSPQPGRSDVTPLPCFARKAKEFNPPTESPSLRARVKCNDIPTCLNVLLVSFAVGGKEPNLILDEPGDGLMPSTSVTS